MQLSTILANNEVVFYDGPMETRIEYNTDIELDPEMSIFQLVFQQHSSNALKRLYQEDIEAVMPHGAKIILNAPTFRASKQHCQRLRLPSDIENIKNINQQSLDLVQTVRQQNPNYRNKIFVTAPIGPKYAGFTPDQKHSLLEEIAYHQQQIQCVADWGVDIISIAAMPGATECIGAAIAASQTNTAYTVGFVLTEQATLLDGTPMQEVMEVIEKHCLRLPLGYVICCTHPVVACKALANFSGDKSKIIGIKANGSAKPPKELLQFKKPVADSPCHFAEQMMSIQKLGLQIFGGCCGTDSRHLAAMVKILQTGQCEV